MSLPCGFPAPPPSCNTHILSEHADTLHNHYCSVEHSKLEVHAQRKRTSVLDQLVSELARDLETAPSREVATSLDDLVDNLRIAVGDGGVIVVGGGYLGQKARPGSKYTPVVQAILKKLAKHFRIVVVDEVRACVRASVRVCLCACVRACLRVCERSSIHLHGARVRVRVRRR